MAHPAQEGGDEVDAENKTGDEEESQLGHLTHQSTAVEALAHAYGGQHHQEQHGHQIFYHQHRRHRGGELLLLEFHVVETLDDDTRGGDGKHASQEGTLHGAEAQDFTHRAADDEHDSQLGECRDGTCGAHLLQFLDAKFKA